MLSKERLIALLNRLFRATDRAEMSRLAEEALRYARREDDPQLECDPIVR